jgi:phospholipid/cholesterol/gamma-HCH transport system substrate-binding protein
VARLASKGLLGDMIINLTVGSADARPLANGDWVRSQETEGLTEVVESVQDAIGEVRALVVHTDERVRTVLNDGLSRDLSRLARSSADVVEKVQKGDGLIHQLVYDPRTARDFARILDGGQQAAADLDVALKRVDRLMAAVEKGQGSAHALLYRDDLGQALGEARRAARELGDVAAAVRTGDGLAHSAIYEKDRTELLANLARLSRALGQVADEVSEGKGTIGALLKDPSVYEDLKTILGNVQRSRVLRELIRYTIKQNGLGAPKPASR